MRGDKNDKCYCGCDKEADCFNTIDGQYYALACAETINKDGFDIGRTVPVCKIPPKRYKRHKNEVRI